jgi:predicted DCC family thiol-disulfide oxidoreductase YuxK
MSSYPLTIYYDSTCPLCRAEMHNLQLRDTHGRLRLVDASPPGFHSPVPGVDRQGLMTIIHAIDAQGHVLSGVDVFRAAYAAVGLGHVSAAVSLPVVGWLADRAYPWVARHRNRIPRVLVAWLFEGPRRQAAERAADQAAQAAASRARCNDTTCRHD